MALASLLSDCTLQPIFFFFFNDTATTEIYTLSLHDALPISRWPIPPRRKSGPGRPLDDPRGQPPGRRRDRKSTRLNSSHSQISYAVFCLKKKKRGAPAAPAAKRSAARPRDPAAGRPPLSPAL